MRQRFTGTLASWQEDRGFGFVVPDQGGQDLFVHASAWVRGPRRTQVGERISFEVQVDASGRKRAQAVQPLRSAVAAQRAGASRRPPPAAGAWLTLPGLTMLLAVLWWAGWVPGWVAAVYAGASTICFFAYAFDKSAAEAGRWRTPESTLLLLGLAGGWPGAVAAQQLLRHKSSKASFQAAFRASIVLNVAALLAAGSPWGARLLAG